MNEMRKIMNLMEDVGDDLDIGMKQADHRNINTRYVVNHKRDSWWTDKHDLEPDYEVDEQVSEYKNKEEAMAHIKAEIHAFIASNDDPSVTHTRGSNEWFGRGDVTFGKEDKQIWTLFEIPINKWIED